MVKTQRRTKEKEVRVEEILTAAKTAFFKKGYFNTTIDEIAQLAGISKGTIYLYFKNKDELYVSLMMPMIEELTRLLLNFENKLIDNKYKTGHELIMAFSDLFYKLYKYDPEGLRVFQVYLSTNLFSEMPDKTRERLWLSGKRNLRIFKGILDGSIKMGLLPEVNTQRILNVLWASSLGIIQWEDSKDRISQKNHLFDTLKYFCSLISNGLGLTKDFD